MQRRQAKKKLILDDWSIYGSVDPFLPVITKLNTGIDLPCIGRFFCCDIDHATHGISSIKSSLSAADNVNAFNFIQLWNIGIQIELCHTVYIGSN